MRTSPRRWRWRTTSAIRRSVTPANARSTQALNDFGGFDHNAQALRIVTDLERRYAAFDGLNLTWETLEGLVKHNGPLTDREGRAVGRYREHGVPARSWPTARFRIWNCGRSRARKRKSRRCPTISPMTPTTSTTACAPSLFTLDDIAAVPIIGDILREIDARNPGIDPAPPRARNRARA